MVGLGSNLIDVRKYDFYVKLAKKLRFSFYRVNESKMGITNVPFWNEVARRYLKAFKRIKES